MGKQIQPIGRISHQCKSGKEVAAEPQGNTHRARRSRSTGFANRTDAKGWIAISERDGKTSAEALRKEG